MLPRTKTEIRLLPYERLIEKLIRNKTYHDITEDNDLQTLLSPAFEALIELVEIVTPSKDTSISPQDRLLGALADTANFQNKPIFTVCLLRLLPHLELRWLTEQPCRPRIMSLFDEQFSANLYRERKIDPELQGHEKIKLLSKFVTDQEKILSEAIHMFTSFNQLKSHRQKLMQTLKSEVGKLLFQPFLPDDIAGQFLDLYQRAENYLAKREDIAVVDAHSDLVDSAERIARILDEYSSYYSRLLADEVPRRIISFANDDFSQNKAVQPAKVEVGISSKRYPFHDIDRDVSLRFLVQNRGPGFAYDVRLHIVPDEAFNIKEDNFFIGRLAPGNKHAVDVSARILKETSCAIILGEIEWNDFDGTVHTEPTESRINAQPSNIDWNSAAEDDPYSLESVVDAEELVGRKETLGRLKRSIISLNSTSWIIKGQKRVGKTSIGKAVLSNLTEQCISVYIEGGDYVQPTANLTVSRLGELLCQRLRLSDQRLKHLSVPHFHDAITPFVDFLDESLSLVSDKHFLFILDEFDELPFELYQRGPMADAFFLSLRSISSRPRVSFILIGGEKMTHISECQGDQLNKWGVISVDYFSRDRDWADYSELIKRPVAGLFDFDEEAIIALHEATAGNPYFTKLICRQLYQKSIEHHDNHITSTEVEESISIVVAEADRNTFQHFWEDGIFETSERVGEKSIRRRKVLIAVSDSFQGRMTASHKKIVKHSLVNDIPTLENEIREFVTRGVLDVSQGKGENSYTIKVPLFARWLKERGVHDVISTFGAPRQCFARTSGRREPTCNLN